MEIRGANQREKCIEEERKFLAAIEKESDGQLCKHLEGNVSEKPYQRERKQKKRLLPSDEDTHNWACGTKT